MQKFNIKKIKEKLLFFIIKFIALFTLNRKKTRQFLSRMWVSSVNNYTNTREWLQKNNLASNYEIVKNMEHIKLDRINHVESEPWFIFENDLEFDLNEVFIAVLPNTRYIPKWNSFITPDNMLLEDLTSDFSEDTYKEGFEHNVFNDFLPEETYIDKNIAILDSAFSSNYFHWVINILPKIEFFEKSNMSIDKYIVDISKSFQLNSLRKMNFDMDKILPASNIKNLRAKNIIATYLPSDGCANASSLDFVRSKLNIENFRPTERIFISRKNANHGRRVTNENEILDFLYPLGFKRYVLEDMTFEEQVELFSHAETIISPHGAGLTNILFCPKGTNIVEMYNPKYRVRCFCILANLMQHNYYYILGDGLCPSLEESCYDCTGDMIIDINKIKKVVDLLNLTAIKA